MGGRGVEPSDKPPNPFNQQIIRKTLLESQFPENFFDAITFWAVLEHVYDPLMHLKEAFRILRPGGTVVFLVTNVNAPATRVFRQDDVPRHTTLFAPKTARAMAAKAGFVDSNVTFHDDVFAVNTNGMFEMLVLQLLGRPKNRVLREQRCPSMDWYRQQRPPFWHKAVRISDLMIYPVFDQLRLWTGLYGIITVSARKAV